MTLQEMQVKMIELENQLLKENLDKKEEFKLLQERNALSVKMEIETNKDVFKPKYNGIADNYSIGSNNYLYAVYGNYKLH